MIKRKQNISRDTFLNEIKRNIGLGVHYQSIPEHPVYKKLFNWKPKNFPNSYNFGKSTVSLPISPFLKRKDINDVIESIHDVFKKSKAI